jgi:TonB family protein
MNRLQRECLAGSLVLHTGLLVLLVVGAGFSSHRPDNTEPVTLLTFIPDKLVDAPMQGGGDPQPPARAAQPPPSLPPPVAPPVRQPEAPKVEKPPPTKPPEAKVPDPPAPRKQPEPELPPVSPDGEKPAPKRKIEVNLQPTQRSPEQKRADREKLEAEARRQQAAEQAELRRIAEARQGQFSSAVNSLQSGLSSRTSVSVPGTGGQTYASYTSFVDLIYRQAWAPYKPRETGDRSLSVIARVVIAKSGEVVSSEIKRRSGNTALDRSVRSALDRVRTIGRPFPDGATDSQREFEIEFNLETRGAG